MSLLRPLFLLGLTTFVLAACGEVRQDLGLGRNPPDEFAVVERPPLSLPPDFALHPPRPGAPRPQAVDTTQKASEAVFAAPVAQPADLSSSEKALLAATGASKAEPDIRETVDHEAAQKVAASPHLVERLMQSGDDQKKTGVVVDANAEAARIKKAQQDDQPVAQGATPVIEKQKTGWLGF